MDGKREERETAVRKLGDEDGRDSWVEESIVGGMGVEGDVEVGVTEPDKVKTRMGRWRWGSG